MTDKAGKSRVDSSGAVLDPECVVEGVSTRWSLHELCERELDLWRVDIVALCAHGSRRKRSQCTVCHLSNERRSGSDGGIADKPHLDLNCV